MAHVTSREHDGGVLVVSLDRPPANAMNLELLEQLVGAIERVRSDPPAALVLAGRAGCFSAGADLKAVPEYGPQEQRRAVAAINEMAVGVYDLPCPVVGAITGHAIAGGLVLALCSDIRIASSAGRYGLTEVKVGVPYPQAAIGVVAAELAPGAARPQAAIGVVAAELAPGAARLLALGNELIDAAECLRLGVFDEVTEPEEVLPRALQRAGALATFRPEVYARTKHELRGAIAARLRGYAAQDPLLAGWVD